jgi:hypothetical protein
MSESMNVRELGNRLGNPFARNSMSSAEVVRCADLLDAYADLLEANEMLTDTALWDFANDLLELWNFRDMNTPSLIEQFRDEFVARFGNPHQVRVQANSETGQQHG